MWISTKQALNMPSHVRLLSFHHRSLPWALMVLTMFSFVVVIPYRENSRRCEPLLAGELYDLVKSDKSLRRLAGEHHMYTSTSICGQTLFQSIPHPPTPSNDSVEEYATEMLTRFGTGFIDFSRPDQAFLDVDHGYTTFPTPHCPQRNVKGNPEIFLSTMVTVSGFRPLILPRFINHYFTAGVKKRNMLFTVQITPKSDPRRVKTLFSALQKHGCYYDVFIGNWSSEALMYHQAHKLKACANPADWIIVADSDEFHEYPSGNVLKFFRKLDKLGYNLVNGLFLDRVSSHGRLEPISVELSLDKQYALGCRLHQAFNLGTPKKVMAIKGYLRINRGHHRLALCWFWARRNYLHLSPWNECPPRLEILQPRPYPERLNVHHFKWIDGQYEATLHKAEVWKGTAVGENYEFVKSHLREHNGICVSCRSVRCSVANSNVARESRTRRV